MIRQLKAGNIPLPKIYVASTPDDIRQCKEAGIPYVVWKGKDETLVKLVLLPTLEKMFPHIKWRSLLKINTRNQAVVEVPGGDFNATEDKDAVQGRDVADIATEERWFTGGCAKVENNMNIGEYVGDLSNYVNIEELQALHLLPSFLDEISTNISKNLNNLQWWEGYNKKRGVPIGNFSAGTEASNLIILDISGSIPRGIADTMIALIDTLRQSANADLIITSSRSKFYPAGTELPSPEQIRREFGLANEADEFNEILNTYIKGRTFGNVISFGDYDSPRTWTKGWSLHGAQGELVGTRVNHIWHYHTNRQDSTGYAKWAESYCDPNAISYNTKWCSCMNKGHW